MFENALSPLYHLIKLFIIIIKIIIIYHCLPISCKIKLFRQRQVLRGIIFLSERRKVNLRSATFHCFPTLFTVSLCCSIMECCRYNVSTWTFSVQLMWCCACLKCTTNTLNLLGYAKEYWSFETPLYLSEMASAEVRGRILRMVLLGCLAISHLMSLGNWAMSRHSDKREKPWDLFKG